MFYKRFGKTGYLGCEYYYHWPGIV